MSGIEILGIVAGVLQVADLGGKLSVKLFTFSRKIKNAHDSINSLSKDLAATGATLQQLASVLQKDEQVRLCSEKAIETTKSLVAECTKVFLEMDAIFDGRLSGSNKNISAWMEKFKYPFLEPQINLLQSNLERLKSSLVVLLNVLVFAEQLRNQEALPILKEQRTLIQVLVEDQKSTKSKFEQMQRTIDGGVSSTRDPTASDLPAYPGIYQSTFIAAEANSVQKAPDSRNQEIEQHGVLVDKVMREISADRYCISHGVRFRMHQAVLKTHWDEWSPLRKIYGDAALLKLLDFSFELRQYWLSKMEAEAINDQRVQGSVGTDPLPRFTNKLYRKETPQSGIGRYTVPAEDLQASALASKWPLARILTWLSSHGFSAQWQDTFQILNLEGDGFLSLAGDPSGPDNMHQIYPQLKEVCSKSPSGWDESRELEAGKRLRGLVALLREGDPPDGIGTQVDKASAKISPAFLEKFNRVNRPIEQSTPAKSFQTETKGSEGTAQPSNPDLSFKGSATSAPLSRPERVSSDDDSDDDSEDGLFSIPLANKAPPVVKSQDSAAQDQKPTLSTRRPTDLTRASRLVSFSGTSKNTHLDSSADDSTRRTIRTPRFDHPERPSSSSSGSQTNERIQYLGSGMLDRPPVEIITAGLEEFFPRPATPGDQNSPEVSCGPMISKEMYGGIYLGRKSSTGQLLVVQQARLNEEAIQGTTTMAMKLDAIKTEIGAIQALSHPNLAQYLGYEHRTSCFSIYLEYTAGGSVGSVLRTYGKFEESVTQSIARQMLEGLSYLHQEGLLHRELQPDNVLLLLNGSCKLSDFGISKILTEISKHENAQGAHQRAFWLAPEAVQSPGFESEKVDVWAIGCIVLAMLSGKRPWSGQDAIGAIYKLGSLNQAPPIPDEVSVAVSAGALAFLYDCLEVDSVCRPSAGTLLKGSIFCQEDPSYDFTQTDLFAHVRRDNDPVEQRHAEKPVAGLIGDQSSDPWELSEPQSPAFEPTTPVKHHVLGDAVLYDDVDELLLQWTNLDASELER